MIKIRTLKTSEIEFRIGEISGDRMELIPYISARTVMRVFDESLSTENWSSSLGPFESNSVSCTISVYDSETGIWTQKTDYGRGEDPKTATSDALKRAAVQWGVGRALYFNLNDCDGIYIDNFQSKVKWRIWKSRVYCDDIFEVIQLGYDDATGELCCLVIKDVTTGVIVYQMDYRTQKQFQPEPKQANISTLEDYEVKKTVSAQGTKDMTVKPVLKKTDESSATETDPDKVVADVGTRFNGRSISTLAPNETKWVFNNTTSQVVKDACLVYAGRNAAIKEALIAAGIPVPEIS